MAPEQSGTGSPSVPGGPPDMGGLIIPGSPPLPGLRFRLFAGPQDIPAMAEVARAANLANGVADPVTVERMLVDYANLTNSDPTRDCILAEVDGRCVAYARVDWLDDTDGARGYFSIGWVHPDWRRRGIGRVMLRHDERRLAEMAAGHSIDVPRWYTTWAPDEDHGALALLASEGYRRVRIHHHMVRPNLEDIDVRPLPDGLEVRPMRADETRAVFDAAIEAFQDHFGGIDGSDQAFARWSQDPAFDQRHMVVAWDGEEVAGAVQAEIDEDENELMGYRRGWTDPIFVRRPWRRRGLATALLARALVLLREAGMTSAQLDVDAENPNSALTLYERVGFRVNSSSGEWRKPLVVTPAVPAAAADASVPALR